MDVEYFSLFSIVAAWSHKFVGENIDGFVLDVNGYATLQSALCPRRESGTSTVCSESAWDVDEERGALPLE